MIERWQNQEEAVQFALSHSACMLDMDMGTGKTRVAIDTVFARNDVYRVLVVCPKAVIGVWRENLQKFAPDNNWQCYDPTKGTIASKAAEMVEFLKTPASKQFVVINYDSVWRRELGDAILRAGFQMVILDESHRAKAAGSKVSKYLAMLGKRVNYKLCLSGTPMANSPLDIYGQYRFLDPNIFGTNHSRFLQEYAIMGGPELRFIVGYKNQQKLNERFNSIAYHCKMADIADRLKLPPILPEIEHKVQLPARDMKTIKQLSKEFVAECASGHVVVGNVLTSLLRMQQICSGFCMVQDSVYDEGRPEELNNSKEDMLVNILQDISPKENVVVFFVFRHDVVSIRRACLASQRACYELTGSENTLDGWKKKDGAVIAVQIQAGAEGVDMTKSNYAIYYSLPHSLAQYNQSKARLYRPGQTRSVSFMHLIAENTVDEAMYKSLKHKKDIIEAIKDGSFDYGSK